MTHSLATTLPIKYTTWNRVKRGLLSFRREQSVDGENTKQVASAAFLIRLAGAACLYLSQALLARWLGSADFGTYIYAWTWVFIIGETVHLGMGHIAQRFIPRYRRVDNFKLVRGFLRGSQLIVLSSATIAAGVVILAAYVSGRVDATILQLAAIAIPPFAMCVLMDGIGRCYGWIFLALVPSYIIRPLLLIGLVALFFVLGRTIDAISVMLLTVAACWAVAILQSVVTLIRLRRTVVSGPAAYTVKIWLEASFPTVLMWGFYTLVTSTDILVLQFFTTPEDVAHYYAATKTLAIVAFVNFAVGAAAAHRFAQYHDAHAQAPLQDLVSQCVNWTFWGSLILTLCILALGWAFLWLYGPNFVTAYPLMFILALGLISRGAVGPAERLISMSGHQKMCAAIYATAFAANVILSLALVKPYGGMGVAFATSIAILLESSLLYFASRRFLGIETFVFRSKQRSFANAKAQAWDSVR